MIDLEVKRMKTLDILILREHSKLDTNVLIKTINSGLMVQ